LLHQSFYGVGEVEAGIAAAGGGGGEDELPTGVVSIEWSREGAVHYNDGVDAAVAPVGEDLVADGGGELLAGE